MKSFEAIFIFLWFYIGWFGCVFLAEKPYAWVSLFFALALLAYFVWRKNINLKEVVLFIVLSLVGIIFDTILINLQYIDTPQRSTILAPIWLISIWFLFCLVVLKNPYLRSLSLFSAAVLGALFGPLSYKSGELLNVLTMTSSITLFIYMIFWGLYFPLMIYSARRFL